MQQKALEIIKSTIDEGWSLPVARRRVQIKLGWNNDQLRELIQSEEYKRIKQKYMFERPNKGYL